MTQKAFSYRFSGRTFTAQELALIREVMETCGGVSRKELANTISELLGWTRSGGGLKESECLAVLERLDAAGLLALPEKQQTRPVGSVSSVLHTARSDPGAPLTGRVGVFASVVLERVQGPDERRLFRELGGINECKRAAPMPITIKYIGYTPCILVASPSADTDDEWVDSGRNRAALPGPVHKDYALMKVLYMLRQEDKTLRIQLFKWEKTLVPVDFSGLRDSDIIYIVGHGDHGGIYAMGPGANRNQDRLVETLTKDGNLKAKRQGKEIIICLLSCRAGLGLHKTIARKLFNKLGGTIDVKVAGAKGFTFGSIRTSSDQQNEVLIRGIPWLMEYETSITKEDAEKATSAREKKTITYDGKKRDIEAFQQESGKLVDKIKDVIKKLASTEVNNALNELQDGSERDWWLTLVWQQQQLYANAKTKSNLEFDMWYADLTEAYTVANGRGITDQDVASILALTKFASGAELTSIK